MLRCFNFEPSFKLRWCRAQDLFESQPTGLSTYFVCKRIAVQTLLWSLEFVIQINLEHNIIAVIRLCFTSAKNGKGGDRSVTVNIILPLPEAYSDLCKHLLAH